MVTSTLADLYRNVHGAGLVDAPLTEEELAYLDRVPLTEEALSDCETYLWETDYEEEPVDYRTFVTSPLYLGATASLYPRLVEEGEQLFHGDSSVAVEVILSGGIGWGKTQFAATVVAYDVYCLACFRSPQEQLALAPSSDLYYYNLGIKESQAQKAFFAKFRRMVIGSPWFRDRFEEARYNPELSKRSVRLPKHINIECGNSTDTSIIGLDVMGVVIDEANWLAYASRSATEKITNEESDHMTELYRSATNRLKSRLSKAMHVPGHVILISSALHPGDWIENHINESRDDPHVRVLELATWESNPENYEVRDEAGNRYIPTFRVQVGNDTTPSRILKDDEPVADDCDEIFVPDSFREPFEKDPDMACREMGGKRTITRTVLVRDRSILDRAYERAANYAIIVKGEGGGQVIAQPLRHPANADSTDLGPSFGLDLDYLLDAKSRIRRYPEKMRHLHIDLGVKRAGDPTGLAMGYVEKVEIRKVEPLPGKEQFIRVPTIVIELMLQVVPGKKGEIQIADVREFVADLKALGYKIRASADQWQSLQMLQELKALGLQVENISMDRDTAPWDALLSILQEDRLILYRHSVVHRELKHLRYDAIARKVDHPAYDEENPIGHKGSKDCVDALCGVVYGLMRRAMRPTENVVPVLVTREPAFEGTEIPDWLGGGLTIHER
jgi:hypothetical protein